MGKFFRKAMHFNWVREFVYRLVRLYCLTFRLTVEGDEPWLKHVNAGGRVVLCTWHQQFFSAIRYFRKYRNYRPALMISKSADGDLIADVARRTGWNPVRGSSSRDGKQALKEVIRCLRRTGVAGHVLDGPRGPMGKVKAGAIHLALEGDAVLVPFYVSADRAWYFNSWDKFFIPKPFARVKLRYDTMITLLKPGSAQDFEAERQRVEDIMKKELRSV